MFRAGLDIGSTTAKIVVMDGFNDIVYSRYERHNARILETLVTMLQELMQSLGDVALRLSLTGTAGMGVAERASLPFVQEVVAAALVVQHLYPEVRTLIDIGGEDGKIILFDEVEERPGVLKPTIRMNGNCAGGTGAFIDQMATLLGVKVEELSDLGEKSTQVYPMASRCGVFAKTDVQTLMSRSVSREDIIASVYRAVAFQTVSSLAHGADLNPKVLFAGGPLGFQPGLRKAFREVLGVKEADTLLPARPELLPAQGAALNPQCRAMKLSVLLAELARTAGIRLNLTPTLPPLFSGEEEFREWQLRKDHKKAPRVGLETLKQEWAQAADVKVADSGSATATVPDSGLAKAATESQESRPAARGFFLGLDCGSRTSKMVLVDPEGRIAASFYQGNDGDPLETVIKGLEGFREKLASAGLGTDLILAGASTGYGEELLQHAFNLEHGVVETLAHFRAAQEWDPEVSFILDIGGQDMKAIFVEDRVIRHMDLNEACSSGTGSFIEGFAINLGMEIGAFALSACTAAQPRDLGTRCTVFMNSKVKQALREGAGTEDISAGLAYSVIKNCFQKVLKIHDPAVLGGHIIAQGGTFKNPAVLRALELHTGQEVIRPDIAELMGAYGAALIARDRHLAGQGVMGTFIGFDRLDHARPKERKVLTCQGCENLCSVSRLVFDGGQQYFTGHKCEKVFSNLRGKAERNARSVGIAVHVPGESRPAAKDPKVAPSPAAKPLANQASDAAADQASGLTASPAPDTAAAQGQSGAYNMVARKCALLFDRPGKDEGIPAFTGGKVKPQPGESATAGQSRTRIGIPRVLNMYEDFPFWSTLFVRSGFEVVLSDQSTFALAEQGYSSVMSENVCFPAKIAHGHILNLCRKQVDRIFFPMIRHDREEFTESLNSFNCPVVTGYPEVIRSAINTDAQFGIPFDCPPMSFRHPGLMKDACLEYLTGLGVEKKPALAAYAEAEAAWQEYRMALMEEGRAARETARREGRLGILLLTRPYHADPLINHKVPEMITALGADVYTDDLIGPGDRTSLEGVEVLTQWAFPNRFYDAALWAADQDGLEVVHVNSFGCGPDALTVDEVRSILRARGKNPTLLRVDEVSSPGSLRLRIRSLLESIRTRPLDFHARSIPRVTTPVFTELDRKKTIIAPMFSPFYTDFIVQSFTEQGYKIVILPMPDWQSVQKGLSYTNHDICYPATIVIGDLIKALQSGDYDPDDCAVAITQTGGQCRASSYASLLKKALVSAGLGQVPVVTLSTGAGSSAKLNEQPGFRIGAVKLGLNGFFGILYADALAKMFYAASVREKEQGLAWETVERWLKRGVETMGSHGPFRLMGLLKEAVEDFNRVPAHQDPLPKVGIVGEIYVKFNPFANNFVTDWLKDRRIEADVPPLVNFFLQKFVTDDFNQARHIDPKKRLASAFLDIGELAINHYLMQANRSMEKFVLPVTPFHTMQHLAKGAERVLSLINQYGESWLIAGDIAGFSEAGTDHVVCLQPFGCIANHIIAKGVEKRLKETYPRLSMLFLDMDAGSSEVNLANRLEFLARSAWGDFDARQQEQETGAATALR